MGQKLCICLLDVCICMECILCVIVSDCYSFVVN